LPENVAETIAEAWEKLARLRERDLTKDVHTKSKLAWPAR